MSSTLRSSGMPVHFICSVHDVCVYTCCVCVEVVCEGVGHTIAHTIWCCLGAHHGEEVDEEVGILPDDQVRLDGRLLKPLEQFRTLQTDRERIS